MKITTKCIDGMSVTVSEGIFSVWVQYDGPNSTGEIRLLTTHTLPIELVPSSVLGLGTLDLESFENVLSSKTW